MDMMHKELNDMIESQSIAFKQISKLNNVSQKFTETVLAIANTICANEHIEMHLYLVSQLSELGTGMFGGRQSDIEEDVILHFISELMGIPIRIRLRKNTLSFRLNNQDEVTIKLYNEREDIIRQVRSLMTQRYYS